MTAFERLEAHIIGLRNGSGGLTTFLWDALARLWTRRLLLPAIALVLLLTASNIFILKNMPKGGDLPINFLLGALVRIGGLIVLEIGILRIFTDSPRRPWAIDGAYALFLPVTIAGIAISALAEKLIGAGDEPAGLLAGNVLVTILLAPFAAWMVAIATARPLAWRPGPYMRTFGRWLPQLIVWSLLLITPLAVLHAILDAWLVKGAGDWFWPVALLDGPLSALFGLIGFSLNANAYRRVTQA